MPAKFGSSAAAGVQIAASEVTQNWSHADVWPSSPGQSWQSGMSPSISDIDIFRDMSVKVAACAAVPAAKAARKTTARMRTSLLIGQTVVPALRRVQIRSQVSHDRRKRMPTRGDLPEMVCREIITAFGANLCAGFWTAAALSGSE